MMLDEARGVLELPSDADEKSIRKAYATLAKTYRPDTHPEEFSRLRAAYDVLLEAVRAASAAREETYQEVVLPSAPVERVGVDNAFDGNTNKEHQRVVSYVMHRLGTEPSGEYVDDEDLEDREVSGSKNDPLQGLQNELIDALKAIKPGQIDSENKVVLLAERYLTSSNQTSQVQRQYAERFLVGMCLGDYYVPHVLRQRVADFMGLGDALLNEDRLLGWEQEFQVRYEESTHTEHLLQKAAGKANTIERCVVRGASWSRVFMFRLDGKHAKNVEHTLGWLDQTYGQDYGIVNDEFRKRWHRTRQIEPLTAINLLQFVLLMLFSGWGLHKLGVPLHQFFSQPKVSMAITVAGLAALTWANFLLVQFGSPVFRLFRRRIRDRLVLEHSNVIISVGIITLLSVIWVNSFHGLVDAGVFQGMLVVTVVVILLLSTFTLNWAWLRELSMMSLVVNLVFFVALLKFVAVFLETEALPAAYCVLQGFNWFFGEPRILYAWAKGKVTDEKMASTAILVGALLCLAMVAHRLVTGGMPGPQSLVTPLLLTLLLADIVVNGEAFTKKSPKTKYLIAGLGLMLPLLAVAIILKMVPFSMSAPYLHGLLALFLIYSAGWSLKPESTA